jgi:hypothetical protein
MTPRPEDVALLRALADTTDRTIDASYELLMETFKTPREMGNWLRALASRLEGEGRDGEPRRYTQEPDGCWVACIAGLTDVAHEELASLIPRLDDGSFDGSMGTEYHNAVNSLLRSRGWRLERLGPDAPKGYAIGSGKSPRGLYHAVIVKDGQLWHDPHPSRAGVVELEAFEVLTPLADSPAMRDPSSVQRWIDAVRSPALQSAAPASCNQPTTTTEEP